MANPERKLDLKLCMKTDQKTEPSLDLPTISDRPDANVIIFDGECRFCRKQVSRIAGWDRKGILSYISLHDPEVKLRWPDLTYDQLMKEMYLIDSDGKRFAGAYVFRWLSCRLPILWPLCPLMNIPGSMAIWKFAYSLVAKMRYRWGRIEACDEGTCKLHH